MLENSAFTGTFGVHTSFVNSFFVNKKLKLCLLFVPLLMWFFFLSLHALARLFSDLKIVSFMLAQHWALFDCCVLLILLPRRKKSTNNLLPLLLQLPKLPHSTTNLRVIHTQASDASALACLLLQWNFVWSKCPQVDDNHGWSVFSTLVVYSRVHCYVALVQNLTSTRMHDVMAERWLKVGWKLAESHMTFRQLKVINDFQPKMAESWLKVTSTFLLMLRHIGLSCNPK